MSPNQRNNSDDVVRDAVYSRNIQNQGSHGSQQHPLLEKPYATSNKALIDAPALIDDKSAQYLLQPAYQDVNVSFSTHSPQKKGLRDKSKSI